jgi:hypothetical protein
MANRRYKRPQAIYEEEMSPEEKYGTSRFFEASIRAKPELQSSFDYSQLDERYPVKSIAGRIQLEEQRRNERPYLEEDIAYRTNLIKDKEAELGLKKAARDLDMYESQINREDAMLEQMPVARQKLAELDVRDPDFINKAYDIQEQHPMAFESDQFQKYIFQPMLNRNSRLTGRKQEGVVTQEGLYKAMGEISKYDELISARGEGVGPSPEEERYLGYLQNQIDQFYAQRGMENPMGVTAPQPTGMAPAMAPSGGASFSSIEEAESAGLPTGTIVYINGRKARID